MQMMGILHQHILSSYRRVHYDLKGNQADLVFAYGGSIDPRTIERDGKGYANHPYSQIMIP